MNLTPLVRTFFARRVTAIDSYADHAEQLQRAILTRLVRSAARTAWGERHGYDRLRCYEDFAARVPLTDYEALKGDHRPHAPRRTRHPLARSRALVCQIIGHDERQDASSSP